MSKKLNTEQAMRKRIRDHDLKSDEHRHKSTALRISLDQLLANQRLAASRWTERMPADGSWPEPLQGGERIGFERGSRKHKAGDRRND